MDFSGFQSLPGQIIMSLRDAERSVETARGVDKIHFQLIRARYAICINRKKARALLSEVMRDIERYDDEMYRKKWYSVHKSRALFLLGVYAKKYLAKNDGAAEMREAQRLLNETPNKIIIAETYLRFALTLKVTGDFLGELAYLSKALIIIEDPDIELHNDQLEARVPKEHLPFKEGYQTLTKGRALYSMGVAYYNLSEFDLALRRLFEARACFEQLGSMAYLGGACSVIAGVYLRIGNSESALEYALRADKLAEQTGNRILRQLSAIRCAEVYCALQRYEEAEILCNKIIRKNETNETYMHLILPYRLLGDIYMVRADFDTSEHWYLKSLEAIEKSGYYEIEFYPYLGLCKLHMERRQYKIALTFGRKSLDVASKVGNKHEMYKSRMMLYQACKAMGDIEQAIKHLETYHELKEQVLNREKTDRIAALELNRKLEKAQQEARHQTLLRNQAEHKLKQREREVSELIMSLEQKNILLAKTQDVNGHRQTELQNAGETLFDAAGNTISWEDFQNRVTAMYPIFFQRLYESIPNLTPSEFKVCALTKLQFSIKEMADALSVTEGAVLKTRWRIRRKLGLKRSQNLAVYLSAL